MAVNFSGMCCTITMPLPTLGSRVSTASSAWVPPVEVPIATTRSVVSAMARVLAACAASIASAVSLGGGAPAVARRATWLMLARAAARTAPARSSAELCRNCFTPILGLVMIARAPALSASMVAAAPFSASEEQTMVGVGCSLMIFLRKVRPSMRGISMSITNTSGHWLFIFSSA